MKAGGRAQWRWLFLPLLVALGVIAMHSVMACGHGQSSHAGGLAHSGMPMPGASPTAQAYHQDGASDSVGATADLARSSVDEAAADAGAVDSDPGRTADGPATAQDSNPLAALHTLLHLCLAVLISGLMIAAAFVAAAGRASLRTARPGGVHLGVVCARGPPLGTPERLSRLCVMRN
ncbi:hypothetical protein [Pseudonocardia sp. WMMC193]|uniref:hypothetical protein n=1 Tax=Pseudonocardia sp. WMMC193 TaxID=2911965 RepID=UPI001F407222|nr:hypothetical protein [Pseudonocardia sp. WMMC193]MCF7552681.1 hypothetical protein [Pseudonocardia sp. WMMC193]